MKAIRGSSIVLLLLVLALNPLATAQDINGSIAGSVQDATGAAVPGVAVTITNTDRNAVIRVTTSDSNGYYAAPTLPIGNYSVTFEANGFKKSIIRDIE